MRAGEGVAPDSPVLPACALRGGDRAERRGRRGGKRQEKPLPRKVPLTPAEPARLGKPLAGHRGAFPVPV